MYSSDHVARVLGNFRKWLDAYGETSWDQQSFFAGPLGGWAKSLYYRHRLVGRVAVAPMIFGEAFLPRARRLFHHPTRFPIADVHYAMGFAFLYEATEDPVSSKGDPLSRRFEKEPTSIAGVIHSIGSGAAGRRKSRLH